MGFFGFAVYIDTSPKEEERPGYVLFGEAVINTKEDSDEISQSDRICLDDGLSMLKGIWCKGNLPVDKMRLFYWEIFEGATGLGSIPLNAITRRALDDEDERNFFKESNCALLVNFHYFAETKTNLSDVYPLWLDFGDRPVWRVQSGLVLKKEMTMAEYNGYKIGQHQSVLGLSTSLMPREYFYLQGEASFTKEWVESRWKVMESVGVGSLEHDVNALISVFTTHVNFWVKYTRDSFKIGEEEFSFELFSNRTMLVQSGDCEDVAAWLMSALNRVKIKGWCGIDGGCMKDHLAINMLLKVSSGAVEGHNADKVFKSSDKNQEEVLDKGQDGNFHVTCFVVHEDALKARILKKEDSKSKMTGLLAEGTGLVFPVISDHVDGLENHKKLLEMAKQHNLKNMITFSGVSKAYENAPDIYHTVFEIMINPEMTNFLESDYDSTIYLTCYDKEGFGLSYPITLEDFMKPVPHRKVFLKPLMIIEEEDIVKYHKLAYFEPPSIMFDGELKAEIKGPVAPGCVGLVESSEDIDGIDFESGFKLVIS